VRARQARNPGTSVLRRCALATWGEMRMDRGEVVSTERSRDQHLGPAGSLGTCPGIGSVGRPGIPQESAEFVSAPRVLGMEWCRLRTRGLSGPDLEWRDRTQRIGAGTRRGRQTAAGASAVLARINSAIQRYWGISGRVIDQDGDRAELRFSRPEDCRAMQSRLETFASRFAARA
jgi:hypothetical protein